MREQGMIILIEIVIQVRRFFLHYIMFVMSMMFSATFNNNSVIS